MEESRHIYAILYVTTIVPSTKSKWLTISADNKSTAMEYYTEWAVEHRQAKTPLAIVTLQDARSLTDFTRDYNGTLTGTCGEIAARQQGIIWIEE